MEFDGKKADIIKSAITEFSKYPYDKVSIEVIVKNAKVSKGLVFHYFQNKKELYDYVVKFALDKITENLVEKIDYDQSDIFERIKEITILKIKLFDKYPNLLDLLSNVGVHDYKKLSDYSKSLGDLKNKVYTYNINKDLFKDNDNVDIKINIIRWSIEQFSEENREEILKMVKSDKSNMNKDFERYIEVLKEILYK